MRFSLVLLFSGMGVLGQHGLQAQQAGLARIEPMARFSTILDGPNQTQKLVPFRFTGKGSLPINLVLDQSSGEKSALKSQLMVIVYEAKGPIQRSIGEVIKIWKSPVMETAANVAKKIPVNAEIPMQPGHYVIDVVVCDTQGSIKQSRLMDYHPAPEKFPGMIINLRQYLVTVE